MSPADRTHLAREIEQQPRLWREVAELVAARRGAIDAFLAPFLGRADARIVLTGAGTSAFAGEVAAPELSRTLRRRVEAIATTDLVSNPYDYLSPDVPTLLVSFARSGNSPESVAATELADRVLSDAGHLIITCAGDGRLARSHGERDDSLVLLMPSQANDQSFAMTSSFTGMSLAALLALGGSGTDPHESADRVRRVADAAEQLLADRAGVDALADLRPERVVYLGSGPLRGLANESALKLLELTAGRVIALSESCLGFRHGPKSVLTPRTLAVVYVSNDPYTRAYDLDLVSELAVQLGNRVVAVDAAADPAQDLPARVRSIHLSGLGTTPDAYWALAAALVPQLLGLATSLRLGLTPDNPFPSGEVNRVVQGVTVHPLPGGTPTNPGR